MTDPTWTDTPPMLPAEARYRNDPVFHTLVDVIHGLLIRDECRNYTPSDVREAAMLACIRFEQTRIRPHIIPMDRR